MSALLSKADSHSVDLMTFTFANGFAFSIDPVMFRIGRLNLYWYGFVYTLGFGVLWLWLWLARRGLGWTAREVSEACIIFILTVMAGGRLFEVLIYEWGWYSEHIEQIPMFWKGGMATHGLLLGSTVGAIIIAVWTRTPLLRLLDVLSVAAAFIFGIGRIGNFIEGGVIGTPTDLPWGVNIPGVPGFRHPVALYDGLKNLLLIPILASALRTWPAGSGMATGFFLMGYGGLRFFIDQFRDYESLLLGMGPGQWFNLAMAGIGLLILLLRRRQAAKIMPSGTSVATKPPRPTTLILLIALILFPLSIPNSWTSEYLHAKRLDLRR
jgi:phosphatidylglycerol:prolipoprotein diacylglycerol transferase